MCRSTYMKGEFWFYPHGYLNCWAEHLMDDAKTVSSGSANYHRISSLLTVLSFEAYLNYIGERNFTDWERKERCPWAEKLELILEKFGLSDRRDKEPFSLLGDLFKYRNTLSHGRIAVEPLDYVDNGDGRVQGDDSGDPAWYRTFGDYEQAKRTLQAVRDSMRAIHEVAEPNDERPPWTIHGEGQSSEV